MRIDVTGGAAQPNVPMFWDRQTVRGRTEADGFGTVEYTLIRIVSEDDPEEGYTIEVEPVSGRVNIMEEERRPEDATSWLPDEGPELDQL